MASYPDDLRVSRVKPNEMREQEQMMNEATTQHVEQDTVAQSPPVTNTSGLSLDRLSLTDRDKPPVKDAVASKHKVSLPVIRRVRSSILNDKTIIALKVRLAAVRKEKNFWKTSAEQTIKAKRAVETNLKYMTKLHKAEEQNVVQMRGLIRAERALANCKLHAFQTLYDRFKEEADTQLRAKSRHVAQMQRCLGAADRCITDYQQTLDAMRVFPLPELTDLHDLEDLLDRLKRVSTNGVAEVLRLNRHIIFIDTDRRNLADDKKAAQEEAGRAYFAKQEADQERALYENALADAQAELLHTNGELELYHQEWLTHRQTIEQQKRALLEKDEVIARERKEKDELAEKNRKLVIELARLRAAQKP